MFRSFGHENSSIIDGGLPRWVDEGFPLDTAAPILPKPGTYGLPKFHEHTVKSNFSSHYQVKFFFSPDSSQAYEDIVANSQNDPAINEDAELVLDARPKGRFVIS